MNKALVPVLLGMTWLIACGDDTGSGSGGQSGSSGPGTGGDTPGAGGNDGSGGEDAGGGGEGTGGQPPEALTLREYLEADYRADCARSFECCGVYPPSTEVADVEACVAFYEPAITDRLAILEAEIAEGKATFDGVAAAECIAATNALDCTVPFIGSAGFPAECHDVFVSTVPVGGVCYPALLCAPGGVCSFQDQSAFCVAVVPVGADCSGDVACDPATSFCDETFEGRRCVARGPDGSSCVGDSWCASEYCDQTTSQCAQRPVCG